MKAKHIRLDGVIEYEGTPEEIARVLGGAQPAAPVPFISAFTITPACVHEYPQPWLSTSPPSCTKCGHQAAPILPVITCGSMAAYGAGVAAAAQPSIVYGASVIKPEAS